MSLTDSYKSRNLEPGVILTKFLILGQFQPRDSYKKNSYKKETVCNKEEFENVLKQRLVSSINFEEFFHIFLVFLLH